MSARVCIHQLFEAQVERTPDATAIVFHETRVTYRDLNVRANKLAHYLRRLGVGPEVQVGIMLRRTVEMIVSALAVLKAGGAYMPLDPEYPEERLGFMREDGELHVLITQTDLLDRVTKPAVEHLIVIEEDTWSDERIENPNNVPVSSDNLAYLLLSLIHI